MSTISVEREDAIREFVMSHHLPRGLGTKEEACSIAAINLALRGELSDDIPECMSPVVGRWIIGIQDAMPDEMRNDFAWKSLLPLAAGTGREEQAESARLEIILDWMWGKVLPTLQPIAEARGFGGEWRLMIAERSEEAARAAAWAAEAAAWTDFAPAELLRRLIEV